MAVRVHAYTYTAGYFSAGAGAWSATYMWQLINYNASTGGLTSLPVKQMGDHPIREGRLPESVVLLVLPPPPPPQEHHGQVRAGA